MSVMDEKDSELLGRIALGEDSVLELKRVEFRGNRIIGPRRSDMADELAAMANTVSGTVVLGIDDKTRDIPGLPEEKLDIVEDWLRSICSDSIDPPLECVIRKRILRDGEGAEKIIIRVDVPRSLFVHRSPGGYFRRIGSSKREMKPDALARLFQQRSQSRIIRFDEQAVPSTSMDDLNPRLWKRFRTSLSSENNREFLEKMRLITRDISGEGGDADEFRPSVAGILMTSDAPESSIPNAFIQAVCYRGTRRSGSYQLDAKDITGPLDVQIAGACRFVERNMRVFAVKAPCRIETPQFSMNAVFEAVVNAVAHRDYAIYASKIRLHIFSDRLEIHSPGCLPNSMTVESIAERQSSRNELLTSLLARTPMNVNAPGSRRGFIMDKRGDGVPIIITESEELSGRRPEYRLLDDAELLLTIFAAPEPEPGVRTEGGYWIGYPGQV